MTDWSNLEFANAPIRSRRAQDFLPIVTDALTCWDFLACVLAGEAALAVYARYVLQTPADLFSGPFLRDIVFGSFIAAFMLRTSGLESERLAASVWRLVLSSERKCLGAFAVLIAVGLATRETNDMARLWLFAWLGIFAVLVCGTRLAFGTWLGRLRRRGDFREAVAIIGSAGARERMAVRLAAEVDVVGLFGTRAPGSGEAYLEEDDEVDRLLDLGRQGGLNSVILALDRGQEHGVSHLVERLKALPVQVALCPDAGWADEAQTSTRWLGGIPMSVMAEPPIKQPDLLAKALVDKLGAALLLLLLTPVLLSVGMAIAATSPGPVIFRQTRRGWCGRDFTIFKFRTMHAKGAGRLSQTLRGDPRCTRIGRFLRASSIDELPQLVNVLLGDMSLVGPRPHAEALHDVDRAGREIVAEYAQRHRVKPGLTGWAQVNGARGATSTMAQLRRRVEFDLYYIENWSLLMDLRILLRTPFCMGGENVF